MKGANEFLLNEATMIEAVQQYFDRQFKDDSVVVTSIEFRSNYSGDTNTFSVKTREKEGGQL